MNAADDPQEWMRRARQDLLCIDNNLVAAEVPWDIVAFHAQQAAEKALKAFLVSRGRAVERTHDLPFLLNKCREAGAELTGLEIECNLLIRYAVQFRCPADEAEITETEGRAAADAARRVVDAVVPLL